MAMLKNLYAKNKKNLFLHLKSSLYSHVNQVINLHKEHSHNQDILNLNQKCNIEIIIALPMASQDNQVHLLEV